MIVVNKYITEQIILRARKGLEGSTFPEEFIKVFDSHWLPCWKKIINIIILERKVRKPEKSHINVIRISLIPEESL